MNQISEMTSFQELTGKISDLTGRDEKMWV